jgi:hypothetical protein
VVDRDHTQYLTIAGWTKHISEPSPPPEISENTAESTQVEDATVPTDEILNTLEQLNAPEQTDVKESQEPAQDPPSEWDVLRKQLIETPYNPDGWKRLVEMAETSGEIDKIKEAYEALLVAYPNTVHMRLITFVLSL